MKDMLFQPERTQKLLSGTEAFVALTERELLATVGGEAPTRYGDS